MSHWVRLPAHDEPSILSRAERTRHSLLPLVVRALRHPLRAPVGYALARFVAGRGMGGLDSHPRAVGSSAGGDCPDAMSDGTTLLPNGWRIQPAGKHVKVGDMPLNLLQTPDSRYMVVTSNGLARPSFSIVDIASWSIKSTMLLDHAWYGIVWHPDGTKLYSAGGATEQRPGIQLRRRRDHARAHLRAAGGRRPELRRRAGDQPGRQDALCDARVRADACPRSTSPPGR